MIDVNNAVAREFSALPGTYPTIATKLVKRGPFSSKAAMYAALDSPEEKERLKQYDKNLKVRARAWGGGGGGHCLLKLKTKCVVLVN